MSDQFDFNTLIETIKQWLSGSGVGEDELRATSKMIKEDFAERKRKIQQEYAAALHRVFFEEGIKTWGAWSM